MLLSVTHSFVYVILQGKSQAWFKVSQADQGVSDNEPASQIAWDTLGCET